ncbi:pentapeptide repeat-containing protein [Streptomyces sp. NBC_00882]|uniref:pentapeptide repeat-containing protein n=1 Tax=Streptomyces sp. NBC_00882 TaxID=2975856 RepID=UPI00386791AE|nr:pentapeptide repeat-containing protein [Streptomyces sp. NBC_00882]
MTLLERQTRVRQMRTARSWGKSLLVTVFALAFFGSLPWLVVRGPYVFDAKHITSTGLADQSGALVSGLRTAIVGGIAALGAIGALLYTARNYRLSRRGQITERFTKALEQLDSKERCVRIGGILALEQIVRDAPEQVATDAARVLGHFIRDHAPRASTAPAPAPDETHPDSTPPEPSESLPDELDGDVQAALTALTRLESRIHVDSREILDFHGLHLARAKLKQADLTYADLTGTMLRCADLSEATLSGALMNYANLDGANLAQASLIEARLSFATLTGARLTKASLSNAYLFHATLAEAWLDEAELSGANLTAATLTGAYLWNARLVGARLHGQLSRADFDGANLTHAHMGGTDAGGLADTNLTAATLTGTNLRDTDLSRVAGLTPAQLNDAETNEGTILPWRQS